MAAKSRSGFVTCKEKVTSPIADEVGMRPNMECGERVAVGPFPPLTNGVALVQCPRGHQFYVALSELSDV
jgi:hypothetical protein